MNDSANEIQVNDQIYPPLLLFSLINSNYKICYNY
jgi:hypothetical protein